MFTFLRWDENAASYILPFYNRELFAFTLYLLYFICKMQSGVIYTYIYNKINVYIHTCVLYVLIVWQWFHNERDDVSNHLCLRCLINCWFRHRQKKTLKLRVTGFVRRIHRRLVNSPHKKASNAENVSISWRHHMKNDSNHEVVSLLEERTSYISIMHFWLCDSTRGCDWHQCRNRFLFQFVL